MDCSLRSGVYAVLGCSEKNSKRFVELYAPLTPKDGGNLAGGPKRTLTLSLEDYRKCFDELAVG